MIPDTVGPEVTLNGDNPVNIYKGHTYTEQGAYCSDNLDGYCGYISQASSGSVDTDRIGTYILTYTFTDQTGNTGSTTRTVNVGNDTTAPIITINGERSLYHAYNMYYSDNGASVIDDDPNFDGNINTTPLLSGYLPV